MTAEIIELPDWRARLQKKNGNVLAHEANITLCFTQAPALKGLLSYDEFQDRIVLTRDMPDAPNGVDCKPTSRVWSDEHITWLCIWLNHVMTPRREAVQNVAIAVAKRNSFHPVRSYLKALVWDGTPRIDTWLSRYLGATDNPEYLQAVGPKFLIGCVARIMQPGCQMDTMLVLEGSQGAGKSTAVHVLGGTDWSRDVSGDLASKDAAIHIQGVWIGEMAELASLRRSEQETIKAFVSRSIDRYRPPYGRNSIDRPRQTCFAATTNESEYLNDPTGARRQWPVACGALDIAALKRDRDQLWAEAVASYAGGFQWHLNPEEVLRATVEQDARQRLAPADMAVLDHLESLTAANIFRVEMREILVDVFELDARKDPGKAGGVAAGVARALVRAGWTRLKPVGRGQRRRQYYELKPLQPDPPLPHSKDQEPVLESEADSQGSQGEYGEIPF